jgi:hypothetical protein
LLIVGPVSDWSILFLTKRNKGIYEPEMMLWVIAAFIQFVPAGLFIFGFGLANGAAWPVLAVGYGIMSFGCAPASAVTLTYLTDSYTDVRVLNPLAKRLLTRIFRLLVFQWSQLQSHAMSSQQLLSLQSAHGLMELE